MQCLLKESVAKAQNWNNKLFEMTDGAFGSLKPYLCFDLCTHTV